MKKKVKRIKERTLFTGLAAPAPFFRNSVSILGMKPGGLQATVNGVNEQKSRKKREKHSLQLQAFAGIIFVFL